MYQTTPSLDHISPAPLLEALTRSTTYPKPAIHQAKLESGLVTEDDMLPMGHCQFLPPLCPIQVEKAVVGSQLRLPCGFLGTVTTGKDPVVDGFPASPHSIKIPHPSRQGPSTYEAMLSGHPEQYAVLKRCGLLRSKLSNRTVHPMTIPFLSNIVKIPTHTLVASAAAVLKNLSGSFQT